MKVVGINGFGRIGRYFTKMCLYSGKADVAVVNDLADIETLAHLLKYDSVHGRLQLKFEIEGNSLLFENGKRITFVQHKNPADIPWSDYNVEVVLESTGIFLSQELAKPHLGETVKKVILSAPPKDETKTVVMGVNEQILTEGDSIISNASCTTNSAAPLVKVLKELGTIESAYITTIHSYTSDQRLHDSPHKDLRRARAAAMSIIPTSTGAAKAITKIFPELKSAIGGCGMRVPVPDGSLTDLTVVMQNPPTVEQINAAFKKAAETDLKGYLEYTTDPIVSLDIVGNPHSVIFDSLLTSVIGNMVKVVGWYDNEAGYSNRLVDLISKL
ncbi:MAG: type I glyceraldehyde-3-phosphate dehydrogenase [Flavobacteriia bacterium]|nr:type I glyceraldehyde-3-phosphate dehydrogenase [Flavobacteriia bacterium]OJX38585.1 MAG: type I glyceraldehyde-3-phosphate dehydrogenase [Flavobacteriia bacterium 40-80]